VIVDPCGTSVMFQRLSFLNICLKHLLSETGGKDLDYSLCMLLMRLMMSLYTLESTALMDWPVRRDILPELCL